MSPMRAQQGIALLESLVAIAILAVGILAALLAQMKTIASAESAMRRVQALRLVEDLDERIKTNPDGFGQLATYSADASDAGSPSAACDQQWCDATAIAQWDVARWKESVARALPAGRAVIFEPAADGAGTNRRLGVIVGWHSNATRLDEGAATANTTMPLGIDTTTGAVTCPADMSCHLAYVQP